MTAFMRDVAGAALPVAIVLLVLSCVARAVVAAQVDHAREQQAARRCLEALSTWSLVALATHTLALGIAEDAAPFALAVPLAPGAVAMLLRATAEPGEQAAPAKRETRRDPAAARPRPATAPSSAPPAPAPSRPPAEPAPAPAHSLWAEPVEDEKNRTGLWSRA